MAKDNRFAEGDKVRDRANVGGQVLETWGNGVKVSWNNGHTGWIDECFLSREGERTVDLADVFGYGPSAPGWKEPH